MATTGKKINELDLISDLTNETVLPAVRIQNQSISSTATKVTVELLKTFIQNDTLLKPNVVSNVSSSDIIITQLQENTIYQYGVLSSLTIESFVTSYLESIIYFETGSSFTLTFTDITWAANNEPTFEANTPYILHIKNGIASVEGLGGDSLPDQTGHSGEFLTTNGSEASWATVSGLLPTIIWYTSDDWILSQDGKTLTIADTTSARLIKVYKNGLFLQLNADYTISGTSLILTTALVATDKIALEVF